MNCKWPFSIVMLNYQRVHEKSRKTNLTITIFMISKSVPKYGPNMKFLNENILYIYHLLKSFWGMTMHIYAPRPSKYTLESNQFAPEV